MLVARMTEETQQAIDRINGVYSSAINTLNKLELTDATIFDFFEKTHGNIRVIDIFNQYNGCINLQLPSGNISDEAWSQNRIQLKEKTRYKIIVMAIEQPAAQAQG